MKRFYTLLALVFLGTQIMAQELSITGTVTDAEGNAVPAHAVFLYSPDSINGLNYSATVYTNENGAFSDLVDLGDMTQGEIIASTESCNETITQSQFYDPGNLELTFDFEICTDTSGGGGNDTISSCHNDFSYSIDGLIVSVDGWELDGNEVEDYNWNFGDGSTANGQNQTHEYASEGEYLITLTTTGIDSCIAITSKYVSVSNGTGDIYLWGQVLIGNNPLDLGTVSLYEITSDTVGGDDFILIAQAIADSAGTYFFYNIPEGNYLILAQADPSSIYYDNTLPTYYGDVIYWVDATIIVLGEPVNPYNINLQLTPGANAGEGQVNGDLLGDGFKKQLVDGNVSLFLLDENNNPLELTYSEIDASFDFSNIAYGDYMVYAEVIGLTTEAAYLTLDAENPTANIEIHITPNGVTTGINDNYAGIKFISDLYPNPVGVFTRLEINLLNNAQVDITIVNQLGQVINRRSKYMPQGENKIELNTQAYPSGIYFMQIKTPQTTITQKFIKE